MINLLRVHGDWLGILLTKFQYCNNLQIFEIQDILIFRLFQECLWTIKSFTSERLLDRRTSYIRHNLIMTSHYNDYPI